MARIVLCSPPLQGHVSPIVRIGGYLLEAGHEVTMITGSRFAEVVERAGMTVVALTGAADFDERDPDSFTPEAAHLSGLALSRHQVMGTFVEPITDQARVLAAVMDGATVDHVFVDATFAGVIPLLGRPPGTRPPVLGLGTLPLAQRSVDVPPYNSGIPVRSGYAARLRNRAAHQLVERVLFRSVQRAAESRVAQAGGHLRFGVLDLSRAFDRFVQLCPAEFEYPRRDLSSNLVFGGAVGATPRGGSAPPWWAEVEGSGLPVVHVTQGTLDNHDLGQLVEPALVALAGEDVHVIVSTGGAPVDTVRVPLPDNAIVVDDIDYTVLLPRTAVLVTNGGYGTVQQALMNAVPVVVAPGGEDKPEVAARVSHFGVGTDLGTRRPTPEQVRTAVRRVLSDPSIADRVRRLADAASGYDPMETVCRAAGVSGR